MVPLPTMSTPQPAPQSGLPSVDDAESPAAKPPESGDLLELLSDECSRNVLACLGGFPRSARELAEELGASRATIYRRLDRLTEAGLVSSTVSIDADGHHRQQYHVAAELATILFGADGVTAAVEA